MKTLNTILLFLFSLTAYAQLNVALVGQRGYDDNLNDIWGYVAPDSTEYALVGLTTGVSIVSLLNPSSPVEVAFIPGEDSTWRDIKTWGDYAYVVCDNCFPNTVGLLIIDLSNLPGNVTYEYVTSVPNLGEWSRAHNIFIDEFGVAYLAGSDYGPGDIIMLDVATTPGTPIFLGHGANEYSHDVYVRDNLMYSSEIYNGSFTITDVTDKQNIQLLGSQITEFDFTHNTWLSADGNVLFTTDEVGNAPVGAYDVSDPNDIIELDQFRPLATLGQGVAPHNVHVFGDYLVVSYYSDGCIIVDATYPDNLIEVGNFDTYFNNTTGFVGAWGAYPFLPSGLILVTDRENGLFVLQPNYVKACYLEGTVTNSSNGVPISEVDIVIENTLVTDGTSPFGIYKTGYAIPGEYNITFSKDDYESKTVSATLTNGVVTILDVELNSSFIAVSGSITDSNSGAVVPESVVRIVNDAHEYSTTADANGNFIFPEIIEGTYDMYVGKWGYQTKLIQGLFDTNNNTLNVEIDSGYADNFSLQLGWEYGNSSKGWEAAIPIGVMAEINGAQGFVAPPFDIGTDVGKHCVVTHNSDTLDYEPFFVNTAMTSLSMDLTGMETPTLSLDYWVFSAKDENGQFVAGDGFLRVRALNQSTSATLLNVEMENLSFPTWQNLTINLKDALSITDNMQIVIQALLGTENYNEFAVDNFQVFDAGPVSTSTPFSNTISVEVFPNPSTDQFIVSYDIKSKKNAFLVVTNILGQEIRKINLENNNGQTNIGAAFDAGIYFVQIENEALKSVATKIVKQRDRK